jgi:hypothetical protein
MGYLRSKSYNTDIQIWAMRNLHPQFKAKKRSEFEIEFKGDLHVKAEFPLYTVCIVYRGSASPVVRVIRPELVADAPHIYTEERTLCLYHPRNFKWSKEKLIANNIVSWTAAWIYFYEVWLEKKKWYGPEASHDILKKQE